MPEEREHDSFRTYATLLSDKQFWVDLVTSTVEQEMDNIPPRQMQFSKEQHYVFFSNYLEIAWAVDVHMQIGIRKCNT